MITVEKAKEIVTEVKTATDALNELTAKAAELGYNAKFRVQHDRSVDYPYDYVEVVRTSLDLSWMSPEETEEFLAGFPDDDE